MANSIYQVQAIGRGYPQELKEGYSQERTRMSELDNPSIP
jgi:hypothetical protein